MIKKLEIRDETRDETETHWDGPSDSYTLCGLETLGDPGIVSKGTETGQDVTCLDCLMIIDHVKEIVIQRTLSE